MFRKTVLASVVIGAGLGTMSGAAFAGDDPNDSGSSSSSDHHSHGSWHHDFSTSCTNNVKALSEVRGGDDADIAPGTQTASPINACHVLDDNSILNGNHITLLGSGPVEFAPTVGQAFDQNP